MHDINTAGNVSRSEFTYDKYSLVKPKKYKIITNFHIFWLSVYIPYTEYSNTGTNTDVVSNVRINHYQTNLWKEMPGEWSCINFFFPILSLSAVVNFHEDEFKGVSESCIYLLSWNWAIEIFHADAMLRINQFRPFYKDAFRKFLDAVLYFQWYQNYSSLLRMYRFVSGSICQLEI